MTISRRLRSEVIRSAEVAKDYDALETHFGGGMHPKAARLWCYMLSVQRAFGVQGPVMEVGVYRGWGSYIPARLAGPTEDVVLVDISRPNLDQASAFLAEQARVSPDSIRRVLVDSAAAPADLRQAISKDSKFRWIHIDGEHSYPAVMADLDTAAAVACAEAVVCVDDVDHPLAPCIGDAVADWLRRNTHWRLVIRGFNKAYLVPCRSPIPWLRFLDFLPELFERYYSASIMLASQTRSSESPYFAYGDPIDGNSYLRVNQTVSTLESFDVVSPRSLLVGENRRPRMLVFGNCQMRVLHSALVEASAMAGMDVAFTYVADVHELTSAQAIELRSKADGAAGLIAQHVAGDRFLVHTSELMELTGTGWRIGIPSMHFAAYWPNHADLQMTTASRQCMPVDAIIYAGVESGLADDAIVSRLTSPTLYSPTQIDEWRDLAIGRLRDREDRDGITVLLSPFLSFPSSSDRLFHTFNHPARQVFDFVLAGVLAELAAAFAPRDPSVLDGIVSGSVRVPYDMSSIDFTDVLPLPSVSAAMRLNERADASGVYRFFRPPGSDVPHEPIGYLSEIRFVRERMVALHPEQREFNREQIAQTTLIPDM